MTRSIILYIVLFQLGLMFAQCQEPRPEDSNQNSKSLNPIDSLLQLKLEKAEEQFQQMKRIIPLRKEARIKFDDQLTSREKIIIDKAREQWFLVIERQEKMMTNRPTNNNIDDKSKKIYQSLMDLRFERMKNYFIDLDDFLGVISGDLKEEIFHLSNKYYAKVLRAESAYNDSAKKFYKDNADRIKNDSLQITQEGYKDQNNGTILGRMDHTMKFLIVDPEK